MEAAQEVTVFSHRSKNTNQGLETVDLIESDKILLFAKVCIEPDPN